MIRPQGSGSVKYALKLSSIFGMCCCTFTVIGSLVAFILLNNKFDSWLPTNGTVVDLILCPNTEPGQKDAFELLINYVTDEGENITSNTNVCSSNVRYDPGDSVDIFYDPEDPEDVNTALFIDAVSIIPAIVLGIACVCCCCSCLAFAGLGLSGSSGQQLPTTTTTTAATSYGGGVGASNPPPSAPVYASSGPITSYK